MKNMLFLFRISLMHFGLIPFTLHVKMSSLRYLSILLIFVLFQMSHSVHAQLIGEEKKYVFLEQAVLERVKSTLLGMTKAHEERIGRLEKELKSLKTQNPINALTEKTTALAERMTSLEKELSPEPPVGCPESSNCIGVCVECPRLWMDPATLYDRFLSRDKLTLTNRRSDSTFDWPTVNDRKYLGAQGSNMISNQKTIYFETDIYYRIEKDLSKNELVFEVGFGTVVAIGKKHYVGTGETGALSIYASTNTQGVTLYRRFNGEEALILKVLSDATSESEKYLKFGFFINRVSRSIAVLDINTHTKLYTFTDVDVSQELWPVFGVYNPQSVFVRLRLNSERDIANVPCDLF